MRAHVRFSTSAAIVVAAWLWYGAGLALALDDSGVRYVSAKSFLTQSDLSGSTPAALQSMDASSIAYYQISERAADAIFDRTAQYVSVSDFPIAPAQAGILELQLQRPVFEGKGRIRVAFKDGWREVAPPDVRSYRGVIQGEEDSFVFLNYYNGQVLATIEHNDGARYTFTSLGEDAKSKRDHALLRQNGATGLDAITNAGFDCKTSDLPESERKENSVADLASVSFDELLEIDVIVEADSRVFQRFKTGCDNESITASWNAEAAYLTMVFAMMSNIYEDQLNITFNITLEMFLDEECGFPSPYQKEDIDELLGEFSEFWKDNLRERDLAHLITVPDGTSTGGIASLNGLCSKDRGYGVSSLQLNAELPRKSYHWDMIVMTHEIGHNIGSEHTHVCNYADLGFALDTCVTKDGPNPTGDACYSSPVQPVRSPGEIMSYCHLGNNNGSRLIFSPPVAALLRSKIETAAGPTGCIRSPEKPSVYLNNPIGGFEEVVAAGSDLEIRWTSVSVERVVLEYSLDGGGSWTRMLPDPVDASDRTYTWRTPGVGTKEAHVRISDASDPDVNDQTIAAFEIIEPSIIISNPRAEERVQQKTKLRIEWQSALLETVRIEYSTDGGVTWIEIDVVPATSGQYTWDVPEVETEEAHIRVLDVNNAEIVSESERFAIGAPFIAVTFPRTGWTLWRNGKYWIQWQSDFVRHVRLEFSPDNGATWPTGIVNFHEAATGTFEWNINPETYQPTEQAKVRVVERGNGEVIGESETFVIKGDGVVSVSEEQTHVIIPLLTVDPNPVRDRVVVRYRTSSDEIRLVIHNARGQVALDWGTVQASANAEQTIEIDVSQLAQGAYYVALQVGSFSATAPFSIIR